MLSSAIRTDNPKFQVADSNTEFDLVKQANEGDKYAFKALFDLNSSRVYAFCLRLCADPDTAQELTQDTFIKAWEKLDSFRFQSKFSTWLHSIAMNEFLMLKRSQKRFFQRFIQTEDVIQYERLNEAEMRSHGETIDIERAISKLPRQARTVFILHDVEGYQHNEISELINIEIGTSKAHLHRARKLLREELVK
ncbi:MAG: sigma-70 family RNA polymerase sigma factor [Ignavibacteriae bacterium]|nr:sigma-70 family RNA polymerase sigma factor [Ignavibacteriota bacterium]MCB0724719.1 sigma-70 family RNA polymerase sigma factor [Ignavibacteriota bacterium]MCB9242268.1 sigma-70 family RNA polymerase sigma factor [Ignavibacteriales bacterium]